MGNPNELRLVTVLEVRTLNQRTKLRQRKGYTCAHTVIEQKSQENLVRALGDGNV